MFAIPSLKELVERTRQAFRSNMPGSDAWIFPNNVNPTGKVFAGLMHGVFGFADYIFRQRFALTADSENLDLHGEEYGLARRPAAPASGFVDIAATGAMAVEVSALFERSDGVQFRAVGGGSIGGAGTLSVEVIATTDGTATVTPAGAPLQIVSGVSDDTVLAQVGSSGIVNGVDVEDDETFRARILFRKRNPPMGGAAADYVDWAGRVSGVSFDGSQPTVFVERLWAGPGTVRVFPLMFDLYADGIPHAADIDRVSDYLQTVLPAGASVTVAAPLAKPIDITIAGLSPDRTDVREAVAAELRAAFRRLSRVAGNDSGKGGMSYLAVPTSFSRSWLWQAVANASGEQRHIISSPSDDVPLAAGQMATLGSISYV